MKNKNNIFTKSSLGLDNSVWLSMIIIVLISIIIFGFKTITAKSCKDLEISASFKGDTGSVFNTGDAVTFSIPAQPGDKLVWNFGDSTSLQTGNFQTHVFTKENDFSVLCTVNNGCEYVTLVKIINPPFKQPETAPFIGNEIDGPDSVFVGMATTYSTKIKAKNGYQWSVIKQDNSIQTKDTAFFTFNEEGPATLQLTIDGNKTYYKKVVVRSFKMVNKNPGTSGAVTPFTMKPVITSINPFSGAAGTPVTILGSWFKGTKSVKIGNVDLKINEVSNNQITATIVEGASGFITVETDAGVVTFSNQAFTYTPPKAATPPQQTSAGTAKPAHMSVTDGMLQTLLKKLITGEIDAQKFSANFCSGDGTLVKVNKEKKLITLAELCKRLQKSKKITIESASVVPDLNNPNCESSITVKYKEPNKYILF